ncbi:MAG: hypothetical protein ACLRSY_06620 [Acutalibacter sp.]
MEGIPARRASASGNASQAVEALVTLGYSASEAAAAVGSWTAPCPRGAHPLGAEELWQRQMTIT